MISRRWSIALAALLTAALAIVTPLVGGGIDLLTALKDFSAAGQHLTPDGLIFWQTRLPRVMTALIAGAALACSGLAYQAVLRNPLADPYILGVSSGAAMGKAIAVLLVPAAWAASALATPVLCFAGAVAPVVMLARLARRQQRFSPVTLLLAGTIVNLVLSAAMMLVQVFANPDSARQITYWWLGGLDVAGYRAPLMALPFVVAGVLVLMLRARAMNLMSVDALTASHLGVDVPREARWMLGAGTLLAAVAVALCGPIGFAGLLVPHILRLAFGPDHRRLVPLCALAGAGFLLLCDLVGWRGMMLWPAQDMNVKQIPTGVITALLGGPVFLWLLVKGRGGASRSY